ncbi:MAG: hypothetical protein E7244_02470 [Enterocloster citroniae]|nr:hypothetical protein [Enterocloster citroniae]
MGKLLGIISISIGIFLLLIQISGCVIEGEYIIFQIALLFIGLGIMFLFIFKVINKKRGKFQALQHETESAKEAMHKEMISMIDSGTMDPINNCQLLLKKGESAFLEYDSILKISQNKVLGTTGKSGGVSVRVAKGLYVRSGTSGSRKIYGDVITEYKGLLTITNQRIAFLNSEKGFEIPLNKLTSITSDFNNIILQQANRTYTLKISNADIVEHLIRKLTRNS